MTTPAEIEEKFWKALKSDRTIMLGLPDLEEGHARPMTASLDGDRGPMWIFTVKTNALVEHLAGNSSRIVCTFASKGNEVFASIHGTLEVERDRSMIDRLWNPFVAAWYEGGKTDPTLELLRLDPEVAEIWLDESSMLAGLKMLLGRNPKQDYVDKVAAVKL
jgi:general stress protein 26